MPERIFPIGAVSVPSVIGRTAILDRLWSALTKPVPDNVQVIGPRGSGKSVILHALAERLRKENAFDAVVLWNQGHYTPLSNEEFVVCLRDQLATGLESSHKQYSDFLRESGPTPYKEIAEVLEEFKANGEKVLMFWDSFEKPIIRGNLNRNLWDQMLDLVRISSFKLLVASRRTPRELMRDPDSYLSEFWGVFDMSPVRISCFNEKDISTALSFLKGVSLSQGAQTELMNWSGGLPPLALSLLNQLHASGATGIVEPSTINACAEQISGDLSEILNPLWADCSEASKDLFHEGLGARGVEAAGLNQVDVSHLTEKGFAKRSGSKILPGCRFLEKHLGGQANERGAMVRLFGSLESFQGNARSFLERRLNHMKTLDPMLRGFIDNSLRWIPDQPAICIQGVRGIIDRALDLIWAAEFGGDRKIPSDYFAYWKLREERGPQQYWDEQFPVKRGHQIRLLQLITGTDRSAAKAKCVTKNTYALANAAHGFSDFGQHIDGAPVGLGTAFAALSVCVELAASLDRELTHPAAQGNS